MVATLSQIRSLRRQHRQLSEYVADLTDRNRDLEAFAGRVAHDLRSPLAPIRGYAELILAAKSADETAMISARICRGVDRMARVVEDLLALSTAGKPPPGVASTTEVVELSIEELGPELVGVELEVQLAGGTVACAPQTLDQVLRNLIGNALKYRAPSRPLRLCVATRDLPGQVEISVEDNGIGMDSETAARAFEPLFRGPVGRDVEGHGLGLAIVERTIRALGGTCELVSTLGRGTRIAFRLPVP